MWRSAADSASAPAPASAFVMPLPKMIDAGEPRGVSWMIR